MANFVVQPDRTIPLLEAEYPVGVPRQTTREDLVSTFLGTLDDDIEGINAHTRQHCENLAKRVDNQVERAQVGAVKPTSRLDEALRPAACAT